MSNKVKKDPGKVPSIKDCYGDSALDLLLHYDVGIYPIDLLNKARNMSIRYSSQVKYDVLKFFENHPDQISYTGIGVELLNENKFKIIVNPFYNALSETQKIILYIYNHKSQSTIPEHVALPSCFKPQEVNQTKRQLFKWVPLDQYQLVTDGLYMASELEMLIFDLVYRYKTLEQVLEKVKNPRTFISVEGDWCLICRKKLSDHSLKERISLIFEKRGEVTMSTSPDKSGILHMDSWAASFKVDTLNNQVELDFSEFCSVDMFEYIVQELEGIEMIRQITILETSSTGSFFHKLYQEKCEKKESEHLKEIIVK